MSPRGSEATGARFGDRARRQRAVILADTHLTKPDDLTIKRRGLPSAARRWLDEADVILHAGDVLDAETLTYLERHAPVHAVLGNNDRTLMGILPSTRIVELSGVRIGMIHDSGARTGRPERLRRRFPDCDVVIFGHSHQPLDEVGLSGQRLFNPGSPTQRRTQPVPTLGFLELEDGAVLEHGIVALK